MYSYSSFSNAIHCALVALALGRASFSCVRVVSSSGSSVFRAFIDMSFYPLGSVRRLCSLLSRRYPSCVCSFEVRSSMVCVSCVCAPVPSSIPFDGLPF